MGQKNFADTIKYFETRFAESIKTRQELPTEAGEYAEIPQTLDKKLKATLSNQGINKVYHHQLEAFNAISERRDTVLVARTASGKTLSFLMPILNEYLNCEEAFSVLLLYPTKALSRDQESTLSRLTNAVLKGGMVGTFDGDTPREERSALQNGADFVITNPDMLHSGILPNHNRKWRTFLSRLRYIVVDEVHTYRGAFGSHAANVFRRLLRVCALHGSYPTIVCASATIGNPVEHVNALFLRDFTAIAGDRAPKPKRLLYTVNPPLVKGHGDTYYRKGTGSIIVPMLRQATLDGVRTICFCRARQEVERLFRAVTDGKPELRSKIQPYRGGLLPNERRELERGLFGGQITTIITTNALELGIDIGDLSLCILAGYPGSMASFWQRAGRVGRKGDEAAIIYVAKNSPVDQYVVHHGDFLTDTPVEKAWLNADNPYIFLQHLPCAAQEYPLRETEPSFEPKTYKYAKQLLLENKTIVPYKEFYRYALQDFPSKGVNLRGMTDYNIEIYCGTEVIGEIDPIGARGTLYKDAIYQHLGRRYMSMDLDLDKKLCKVEPVDVDYFTEAVWEGRIEMTDVIDSKTINDSAINFGEVYVNKQPKLFKKIRERSFENIGYGPITLPAFEYETSGISLVPSHSWQELLAKKDRRYIGAALYGLSYIIRRVAPSLCLADLGDIGTDVSLTEHDAKEWSSAIYLYDQIEGGVGYAEKIYEQLNQALKLCRSILRDCECKSGCPSCIPTLPPGVQDESIEELLTESNAGVCCTESLLTLLIDGVNIMPEVKNSGHVYVRPIQNPVPDAEEIKFAARLDRASKILSRKRSRIY